MPRPKQWSELSFQQQVLIPRRSVASGEEEPTLVRMPRLQERPQMRRPEVKARQPGWNRLSSDRLVQTLSIGRLCRAGLRTAVELWLWTERDACYPHRSLSNQRY